MSLDWGRPEDAGDSARTKRLAGSYVAALVLVAAVLGVGIVFGGQIKKQVLEEEEVTVKLVTPEPVKAAPPPPPPPALPKPAVRNANPGPKGAAHDAPPTELPKGPPAEGDPNQPKEEMAGGDPNGVVGGTGRGGGIPAPASVEPPSPPAPPPAAITQIAEAATPPIARAKTMPAYPEDARRQGIEALVVVKFTVTEDGRVENPTVVKGHPMFDDVVLASVREWTFEPATLDGHAVRMTRMVKIPFRLKHS